VKASSQQFHNVATIDRENEQRQRLNIMDSLYLAIGGLSIDHAAGSIDSETR